MVTTLAESLRNQADRVNVEILHKHLNDYPPTKIIEDVRATVEESASIGLYKASVFLPKCAVYESAFLTFRLTEEYLALKYWLKEEKLKYKIGLNYDGDQYRLTVWW